MCITKGLNYSNTLIIFGTPLAMIAALVLLASLAFFTTHSNVLSLAITIDLLVTIPFIYFLGIRKTAIPKTTVVPFIILGVIICSFIVPLENQYYLNGFKIDSFLL
jgi:hypothetical protein